MSFETRDFAAWLRNNRARVFSVEDAVDLEEMIEDMTDDFHPRGRTLGQLCGTAVEGLTGPTS